MIIYHLPPMKGIRNSQGNASSLSDPPSTHRPVPLWVPKANRHATQYDIYMWSLFAKTTFLEPACQITLYKGSLESLISKNNSIARLNVSFRTNLGEKKHCQKSSQFRFSQFGISPTFKEKWRFFGVVSSRSSLEP